MILDFEHSAVPTILNRRSQDLLFGESPVFVIRSRWDHDEYYDPQNSKGIADALDAFALDGIRKSYSGFKHHRTSSTAFCF